MNRRSRNSIQLDQELLPSRQVTEIHLRFEMEWKIAPAAERNQELSFVKIQSGQQQPAGLDIRLS
jgi:hypothetical protein